MLPRCVSAWASSTGLDQRVTQAEEVAGLFGWLPVTRPGTATAWPWPAPESECCSDANWLVLFFWVYAGGRGGVRSPFLARLREVYGDRRPRPGCLFRGFDVSRQRAVTFGAHPVRSAGATLVAARFRGDGLRPSPTSRGVRLYWDMPVHWPRPLGGCSCSRVRQHRSYITVTLLPSADLVT